MNKYEREVSLWIDKKACAVHTEGCIVLSPPGSGKTFYAKHNHEWVDVDDFLGAHLKFHTEAWHSVPKTQAEIKAHYLECDKYLSALKNKCLWVVGSLFWNYVPDVIIMLPEKEHKAYVAKRPDLTWDTAADVRTVLQTLNEKNPAIQMYTSWNKLSDTMPIYKLSEWFTKNT